MTVAPAEVLTVLAGSAAATVILTHPRPRPLLSRRDQPPLAAEPESDSRLYVGLLGPVTVTRDGAPVTLTARQTELVAFLAAHPDGVSQDRLRAALWGDRPATRGSFNNLVWVTRRRLGTIAGAAALPVVGEDRRYRLHPSVGCDLRLLDAADSRAGAEELLGAVRGRPFDAPRGYGWVDRDGLEGWAANRIAAVAHQLAGEHLAAGEPRRALQVAQRGLLAGFDERLFAARMQAHAAFGEQAAVERVLDELIAVFDGEDPLEVLHPTTIECYRRCGGRRLLRPPARR